MPSVSVINHHPQRLAALDGHVCLCLSWSCGAPGRGERGRSRGHMRGSHTGTANRCAAPTVALAPGRDPVGISRVSLGQRPGGRHGLCLCNRERTPTLTASSSWATPNPSHGLCGFLACPGTG